MSAKACDRKILLQNKNLKEVDLTMAPSLRRRLDGQGMQRTPGMTQAPRSRQSLNGQEVHKILEKLRLKKPNMGLNVRVGSWNLGSNSGRGVEVCEQLRRWICVVYKK